MAASPEERLKALGITLPTSLAPVSGYVGILRTGNTLIVSGQLCYGPDAKLAAVGRLGAEVSIEQGRLAARCCAINVLGRVRSEIGSLDRVVRVLRLGGFLMTTWDFSDHAAVMIGATEVMTDVFGDSGRHARCTIGVASAPLGSTVQVDAMVEIA